MSATRHRNQIVAIDQPRTPCRQSRCELSYSSRSSQLPNACTRFLGWSQFSAEIRKLHLPREPSIVPMMFSSSPLPSWGPKRGLFEMVRTRDASLLDVLQPLGDQSPAVMKHEYARRSWRAAEVDHQDVAIDAQIVGSALRSCFIYDRPNDGRPSTGSCSTWWPPPIEGLTGTDEMAKNVVGIWTIGASPCTAPIPWMTQLGARPPGPRDRAWLNWAALWRARDHSA
jgi:hypothetical protein